MMNLKEAGKILEDSNQLQLLRYYDELSSDEQLSLIKQISKFDFSSIHQRYLDCLIYKPIDLKKITPIIPFIKEEITNKDKYIKEGENIIRAGELAIITLAGGNGTRLGTKGPKGAFKLEINNKKISLFEILLNQIKAANKKYNTLLSWIIMTNEENHDLTVNYFEENNYWQYPKEKIIFFKQNELPILNLDGKCVLKTKSQILTGPNGGGDLFSSLKTNKILSKLKKYGIKYIHVSSIDNVLINLIDPFFLGLVVVNKYPAGTKSITKNPWNTKEFVLTKFNNKPYLLNHKMFDDEFTNQYDGKRYLYRDICIHSFIFRLSDAERFAEINTRYYKAPRMYNYLNEKGVLIQEKCYKYEKLIFEFLPYVDDLCVLRIKDEDEFYPLKSMDDYDNLINLLIKKENK